MMYRTLETLRSENGQLENQKDAMRQVRKQTKGGFQACELRVTDLIHLYIQKLDVPQPNKFTAEREALQSENTSLRMALLTALQGLSDQQPSTQEAETEAEATPS